MYLIKGLIEALKGLIKVLNGLIQAPGRTSHTKSRNTFPHKYDIALHTQSLASWHMEACMKGLSGKDLLASGLSLGQII